MTVLSTQRLVLFPISRTLIEHRLREDAFEHVLDTPDGPMTVHFTAEWPGVPLGLFPAQLERLTREGLDEDAGSFVAVTRAGGRAVGQLGKKGDPDASGNLEIGYGFNPSDWGQGYATEAVQALSAHLLGWPGVRSVTAQTAVANVASQRVLEKAGFVRTGTAHDPKHGDLLTWATPANGYSAQ